jgi:hypothetical protein
MIAKIDIPIHLPRKDLFSFLAANKSGLILQKKLAGKVCDPFIFNGEIFSQKGSAVKAGPTAISDLASDMLNVKAIINTTKWMDSHLDVHFDGLWKKNLQENKMQMHLQEHSMLFKDIISDGEDLRVSAKKMTWKSLGLDYDGSTEALLFDSDVRKKRNPYMFDQYANGYVKNHSVFMQYIKIVMCVNEPDSTAWGAEYEAWEKYFPEIVNKDFAEEIGFFWAVLEAKIIEGSAVPRGSNIITPTLSVTPKNEPPKGTPKPEPVKTTQKAIELLKTKNIFE